VNEGMTHRKLLTAAIAVTLLPVGTAAATPPASDEAFHQVQVQSAPGDRHHEVDMTRTATALHRVVRDLDRDGRIVTETLVDGRTGLVAEYDGRRGVRYERKCAPIAARWLDAAEKPVEVIAGKIASGAYTVTARRVQFGRTVLDLTGDIGEPDVGPQRVDVSIDEGTGTELGFTSARGARTWTTAFSVADAGAPLTLTREAQRSPQGKRKGQGSCA
jgi:hypothetical protein